MIRGDRRGLVGQRNPGSWCLASRWRSDRGNRRLGDGGHWLCRLDRRFDWGRLLGKRLRSRVLFGNLRRSDGLFGRLGLHFGFRLGRSLENLSGLGDGFPLERLGNARLLGLRLPLGDDDLCYVVELWGLPTECTLGDEQYQMRGWIPSTMAWKASDLCHKPLYFEEVQLERYGHTSGPITQPVVSGAHFFLNIATLPYKMGLHPPNECRYPLGYYRPGNCAPWLLPPVPISARAGLMQAGAVVGGAYVIP